MREKFKAWVKEHYRDYTYFSIRTLEYDFCRDHPLELRHCLQQVLHDLIVAGKLEKYSQKTYKVL